MLTRKQQELLLFINQRLAQGGVSPSFEEMKEALDLKSKSGIHRLISGRDSREQNQNSCGCSSLVPRRKSSDMCTIVKLEVYVLWRRP